MLAFLLEEVVLLGEGLAFGGRLDRGVAIKEGLLTLVVDLNPSHKHAD